MRAGHARQAVAEPSGEGKNETGPRSSCVLAKVTLPFVFSLDAAPGVMMSDPSAEAQSLRKNDACAVSDAKRALLGCFLPFLLGNFVRVRPPSDSGRLEVLLRGVPFWG